ncbi:MAG: class I SAM-dependent methyltransferase [Carbonactinosporaceae bacterium]
MTQRQGRHSHEYHYERLASNYDDIWTHSPDYLAFQNTQISRRLRLRPDDRFADIGGGTGLFTRGLVDLVELREPALVVEPHQPMLDQMPDHPRLRAVPASMEEVAEGKAALPYDKLDAILVKETIHHSSDPVATTARLGEMLNPEGRFLIVTLPPRLAYPLWQTALDRFESTQPAPEDLAEGMRRAGLEADVSYDEFTQVYDAERYFTRVRARCMSVLETFSDDEVEAGIEEVKQKFPGEHLEFADRFAFVFGSRPA